MIFTSLLLAAAAPTPTEAKFDQCIAMIEKGSDKAIEFASQWQVTGGGIAARQCLGLAYFSASRFLPAMTAFQQAAQLAERQRDPRVAILWVLAGNAALAANQPQQARTALEAAIATGNLRGIQLGEAYLDRGRALMSLRDMKGARFSFDTAIKLVPADPLAWLLSATLARREGQLARAETDIAEAMKRSPDDPTVALEAGNIAMLKGNSQAARIAWQAAAKAGPKSAAGKAAIDALKQFEPKANAPAAK